ncbi:MAG: acyl-CoA dehydrogenase family protein [Thermaerobacter sp.]|nr:acyl-CoA dehydrogenase family protein [Thermaerobacter sp.]
MPDFLETEQEKTVRAYLNYFARTEIRPRSLEADRMQDIQPDFYQTVQKSGISMEMMPRNPGSSGKDEEKREHTTLRLSVLASEELSWGDASFLLSLPGPGLGGPPVSFIGTKEQRERFFSIFKDKEKPHFGAYALTEPEAGSDVAGIKSRCEAVPGGYKINGTKTFITNGSRADWVVVFATIDPSLGRGGHRTFVVERGTPGFSVGRHHHKLGLRANDTAELVFSDCFVPEENLLGGRAHYEQSKEGFKVAMATFDSTRPLVAAMAVGIARAAAERARELIEERYMLGRPLPRYRALREALDDMDRRVRAARLLTWKSAFLGDVREPQSRAASMAKAYAGKEAVLICREALELTADSGEAPDPFLEKWFRDIRVFDIFEGTAQVQRLVIARRLFEEIGVKVGL